MLQDRAGFTTLAHGLYDTVLSALQAIEAKDKTSCGDAIDRAYENCHTKCWYAKT